MKVSIIGGGGTGRQHDGVRPAMRRRGTAASASSTPTRTMAQGVATDLLNGASLVPPISASRAGDYSDIPSSDIVVITAGLRPRKPDESRLDLINRTRRSLFGRSRSGQGGRPEERRLSRRRQQPGGRADVPGGAARRLAVAARRRPGHAAGHEPFPRAYLARRLQAPPTQVQAMILRRNTATAWFRSGRARPWAGLPAGTMAGLQPDRGQGNLRGKPRRPAPRLSSSKGGSGFGVGLSIREVVHRVLARRGPRRTSARVLAGSARCNRASCGIAWTYASVGADVKSGAAGARKQFDCPLTPKERGGE